MAELGSHQLDAASIFWASHPPRRDRRRHAFLLWFPGNNEKPNPGRSKTTSSPLTSFPAGTIRKGPNGGGKDPNDIVVVTTLRSEHEWVRAVRRVRDGYSGNTARRRRTDGDDLPEKDPNMAGAGAPRATTATVLDNGWREGEAGGREWCDLGRPSRCHAERREQRRDLLVSRGYKERDGRLRYCVKLWNQSDKANRRLPRCHGKVAMADAIIALTPRPGDEEPAANRVPGRLV